MILSVDIIVYDSTTLKFSFDFKANSYEIIILTSINQNIH